MKELRLFIEVFFCLLFFGCMAESTTVLQQILELDGLDNGLNLTKNCREQLLETKKGIQRRDLWSVKCEFKNWKKTEQDFHTKKAAQIF